MVDPRIRPATVSGSATVPLGPSSTRRITRHIELGSERPEGPVHDPRRVRAGRRGRPSRAARRSARAHRAAGAPNPGSAAGRAPEGRPHRHRGPRNHGAGAYSVQLRRDARCRQGGFAVLGNGQGDRRLWSFTCGCATDAAGNYSHFDAAALDALGNTTFTVVNKPGYDLTKLALSSGSLITPTVSVASHQPGTTDKDRYAGAWLTAPDGDNTALAGVRQAYADFYQLADPGTCIHLNGYVYATGKSSVKLAVGTQGSFARGNVPGDYELHSVYLHDYAGNYASTARPEVRRHDRLQRAVVPGYGAQAHALTPQPRPAVARACPPAAAGMHGLAHTALQHPLIQPSPPPPCRP